MKQPGLPGAPRRGGGMNSLKDVQSSVMDLFGYREPQRTWDRLMGIDVRDYIPTGRTQRHATLDSTSVLVGVAVGVAIGFGLGLALKESLSPAVQRARARAKEAMDTAREQVP